MDLGDIIQLVIGLLFFVLPTIGRLMNRLRRGGSLRDDAAESEERFDNDDSHSRYDYNLDEDLEDEEIPDLVARDSYDDGHAYEEAPVEVGPGASRSLEDEARESLQRSLGGVFRRMGFEVSFASEDGGGRDEAPPEWVPDERVVEEVPEEELLDPSREQSNWDPHGEQEQAREWYASQMDELEAQAARTIEEAEHLRMGKHLSRRSVRSLEVLRDAIVLNTMLARPEFGSLPLKRGPR